MADVKIIDIDSVQWNIKDQDARNEITTLKTEIVKLKTIEKWEYTVPTHGGRVIARRQGNVINIIGYGIGNITPIAQSTGDINFAILPERFRPLDRCFFMLRVSGSYSTQYGGVIFPDGRINSWTYMVLDDVYFSVSYIVD